jgi:hypothetical protein
MEMAEIGGRQRRSGISRIGRILVAVVCSPTVLASSRGWAQSGIPPTIEVLKITSPGARGFTTYFFDVIPPNGSSITTVEARFSADVSGAMRQLNPSGLATVLNDNNGAIANVGENPLADSQFEFNSNDAEFIINDLESNTELTAALAGLSPRSTRFTLAHVVLVEGVSGMWEIGVVQSDAGISREYQQFGVFGPNTDNLGDFNSNGIVDAADYVVWRDTLGDIGAGLPADGNMNQVIDIGDYGVWNAHFGQSDASGALTNSTVPEPTATVVVLTPIACSCLRRRPAAIK